MYSQFVANIGVNLKFYRRNRLLLIASIFILGVLGLSVIPAFFFLSTTKHLEMIKVIFSQMSNFTTIVTAGLGLLFISHHLGNRTTKMVFTKPCPPEIWLLSSLLSASIVCFSLYIGILLICSILSFCLKVPFLWAIVYMTFNEFLQATIVLSYITFLAVIFHPVLAVLFIIIFGDGVFYPLKLLLIGGIKASGEGALSTGLKLAKLVVDTVYLIVPNTQPFFEKMSSVYSSFRISVESWKYLSLAFAYTLCIVALLFLMSIYFLRKKRHI